jgi:small-conductance mechanosensitive channel
MTTLDTENKNLQVLQANLIQVLGQLSLLEESKQTIREEISKVQGKIEILNEQPQQQPEKPTEA